MERAGVQAIQWTVHEIHCEHWNLHEGKEGDRAEDSLKSAVDLRKN
jgi:hypothetical protein